MVRKLTLATVGALALACGAASSEAGVLYQNSFDTLNAADWTITATHPLSIDAGKLQVAKGSGGFWQLTLVSGGSPIYFSRATDTVISVSARIMGDDTAAEDGFGEMGLRILGSATGSGTTGNYNFRIHTDPADDAVRVRDGNTVLGLGTTETALGLSSPEANFHLYELRVTIGDTSNQVELFIDSNLALSESDTTTWNTSYVGFAIWGGNNNDIQIDDVSFATSVVPEPGSIALVGLAAGGLFLRRRH